MKKHSDIIIIGAGICGLSVAKDILGQDKTVTILEARNRVGGRIETIRDKFMIPVEAGAEFIHGDLPLTKQLMKEAGSKVYDQDDVMYLWKNGNIEAAWNMLEDESHIDKAFSELKQDIPFSQFLEVYLGGEDNCEARESLKKMAEGFDAADTTLLSTFAVRDERASGSMEETKRIAGGYGQLIGHLFKEIIEQGGTVLLNKEVSEIHWEKGNVKVVCGKEIYEASKIIVTVPLGVLSLEAGEKGHIAFSPPVSEQLFAVKKMGYGPVVKVILQFKELLWANEKYAGHISQLSDLGFLIAEGNIPVWWTQDAKLPVITGWAGGPNAAALQQKSDEEIITIAAECLARALNSNAQFIKEHIAMSQVCNWGADSYARGAYAYVTPETQVARDYLLEPLSDVLYFSGEALSKGESGGTVEAALASAAHTVKLLQNYYKKQEAK